jgi:hypothetical protein
MMSTQLIKICAKSDDVSIYDITTIACATSDDISINVLFFFKYYNKKLIDPRKFIPKCWFNDLTNVTFHKSPTIVIATHMNHLHTTQKLHIY